jgi:predicted choloylglycine hydrolase
MATLEFQAIEELQPGPRLRHIFDKHWPSYRRWFLSEGDAARPSYLESSLALERHMPELVPLYKNLLELLNCGDTQARFLSLYQPPLFASGCSQLIWRRETNALMRNYDYPASLCDGLVIKSQWTDTGVLAMTDCLWGALDGLNEHGLTVSLAYGGRPVTGEGFGITLVLRYILETCQNVAQAVAVLQRVPVHMSYNVALLEKSGKHATVFLAPDRDVEVTRQLVSANRQSTNELPHSKLLADTVAREDFLHAQVMDPLQSLPVITRDFLRPPLYRKHEHSGAGTLYTAIYHPGEGRAEYWWPGRNWNLSLSKFSEQSLSIDYD